MNTVVNLKNKDVFQSDPSTYRLVNQGVAKLEVPPPASKLETLKGELQTFVCDGQYAEGLAKILDAYLAGIGRGVAPAVWISGFYGSGKSHLASMLAALWLNVEFPDGARARGLVAELPEKVLAPLKELDAQARRLGGVFAAGGSMEGGGDPAALVLGMVFRAVGLPDRVRDAEIAFWLADEGILDVVRARLGDRFADELRRATLSTKLAEAVLAERPALAADPGEFRKRLQQDFPERSAPTLDDVERLVRRAISLGREKEPLTLIVLDEVQQFIDNDPSLTLKVQNVVERLTSAFDGRLLVVATGQQALGDVPNLQKLLGRFSVTVALGDADIDRVIRKTVLQKKAGADQSVRAVLDRHSGEISRHLHGSRHAHTPSDDADAVADWPLLPSRRRLWRTILTEMDQGLKGNLRGQLQTTVEAVKRYADRPLGHAVSGDFLYTRVGEDAFMNNLLSRETRDRIETLRAGSGDDPLKARILMLVYMLERIARDADRHGVRAKPDTIADLLIEDLAGEPDVRRKVPELLRELQDHGAVVEIEGGEWRLQTKESAEWEAAFKEEKRRAASDVAATSRRRSEALWAALDDALRTVGTVNQGQSKTPRKVHRVRSGEKAPADGIVLRVHDGYVEDLAQVETEVMGSSPSDPTVYFLVPREQHEALAQALQTRAAAEAVLAVKGVGGTGDAIEARKGMDNRLRQAEQTIREVLAVAVANAKVMQAGGAVISGSVAEAVRTAAQRSADRLYPKFSDADHSGWGKAYEQASKKQPDALRAVDYTGEPDKNPVARAILDNLGAGKTGRELRALFDAPPYGWPQDAVDAVLLVLATPGIVRAIGEGGQAVTLADLPRSKLPGITFRLESVVVTAKHRVAVRRLLDATKTAYQPNAEAAAAPTLVQTLELVRQSAGGPAPAPEPPVSEALAKAKTLAGAELVVYLADHADDLLSALGAWRDAASRIQERQHRWRLLERLVRVGAAGQAADVDTLRASRALLAEPDPVPPLLQAAADELRARLNGAFEEWQSAWDEGEARLKANDAWSKLDGERKHQLRVERGLKPRERPQVDSPDAVADALERCSLAQWEAEAKALPQRVAEALRDAAVELEPKARHVRLTAPLLKTREDLDAWLSSTRERLAEALEAGPVVPEL